MKSTTTSIFFPNNSIRFDGLRDQYIEKKGFSVNRIELFGKKIDDVVNEIDYYVTLQKEKIEDDEIQALYARPADAMIQAIYAKDGDVDGSEPEVKRRVYVPPSRRSAVQETVVEVEE